MNKDEIIKILKDNKLLYSHECPKWSQRDKFSILFEKHPRRLLMISLVSFDENGMLDIKEDQCVFSYSVNREIIIHAQGKTKHILNTFIDLCKSGELNKLKL